MRGEEYLRCGGEKREDARGCDFGSSSLCLPLEIEEGREERDREEESGIHEFFSIYEFVRLVVGLLRNGSLLAICIFLNIV